MGKSDKKEKKEKKRADNEAATVVVEAEAVTAAGVGAPAADAGEVSMAVDGETSAVTAAKKDKKSKKDKKDKKDGATSSSKKDKDSSKKEKSKERKELEIPADALSPIAHPLAGRKLNKSTLKLVKRAARARHVKRGVKEVVKAIKKGEKGFVIMAADISPMDILTHIPLLAEEANCPYVFVTSKDLLGQASSTKRPTSCVMICPDSKRKPKKPRTDKDGNVLPVKEPEDYKEDYKEVVKEVEALDSHIAV